MSTMPRPTWTAPDLEYPETDGQPMAENTTQFRWIVTIKEGLADFFRDRDDVFVAGDLFWYPVQGRTGLRLAPDVLVVIGRPPGDRRSYKQWEEDGIAPQVVFEVLSPGNTAAEMRGKLQFYDRYGVQEYYVYDPDDNLLEGWLRKRSRLSPIADMTDWTSPRLGLRFHRDSEGLSLVRPDGRVLQTYGDVCLRADEAEERAVEAEERAVEAEERADKAQRQADKAQRQAGKAQRQALEAARRTIEAQQRADRLAEKLRALGIDPDDP